MTAQNNRDDAVTASEAAQPTDESTPSPTQDAPVESNVVSAPVLVGFSMSLALLAIAFGVTSLILRTDLHLAGVPGAIARALAFGALIAGALAVLALAVRRRAWTAEWWSASLPPVAITAVIAVIACVVAGSKNRDVSRLFDSHGAFVYAIVAAVCGSVALCTVAALPISAPRRARTSAVVALLVIALVVPSTITLARSYANPWRPHLAAAEPTAPLPTDVTEVAYRTRLNGDGRDPLARAGDGFVAVHDNTVTAYDGRTGSPRWSFDFADLTVDDQNGRQVTFTVEPDGTVSARRANITVGLDPVTGEIRSRSVDDESRSDQSDEDCSGVETHAAQATCLDGQLELTDRTTGAPIRLQSNLPSGNVVDVAAVSVDEFAVLVAPTSPADSAHVVVINDRGQQVDSAPVPGSVGQLARGPRGTVVLIPTDVSADSVFVRSYAQRHTVEVPAYPARQPGDFALVGDHIVATLDGHSLSRVNPLTGAVQAIDVTTCTGSRQYIRQVLTVPGAVIAVCELSSGTFDIIGFR
ncbi:hypothetical protein [Gordonia aichiensis]|uniref:Uncharacterized protein n=1 Tax=Gordonia aichiensis NBRC 108223 TaxID=1220583 RepID=L7KGB6_9ACTN|nr:hypothetical protein [Gordonia aichiensis]GAC46768.1 hypothetical protein GOACH_01_00870 [Gordonia aichiensis NBRC 108223]